jgi:hypothetical protein
MQANAIVSDIERQGFALLRQAVSTQTARDYLAVLDVIYAGRTDTNGDVTPEDFNAASGLELEDLFDQPQLMRAARLLIGRRVSVLSTFMSVGHEKAIPGLGLHTDGIIQGTTELTLTMWAPLHSCGTEAPGISVVPASNGQVLDYLRKEFPGKQIPGWCSTSEWAATGAFTVQAIRTAFGEPYRPTMDPGDVMLLTNWTIHGTNVRPEMTKRRSAAILRLRHQSFAAAARAAPGRMLRRWRSHIRRGARCSPTVDRIGPI